MADKKKVKKTKKEKPADPQDAGKQAPEKKGRKKDPTKEAVTNAVKHRQARNVWITLTQDDRSGAALAVKDDGAGLPEDYQHRRGMGLHTMNYRARMIGGTLTVQRDPGGGTVVTCSFHQ